MCHTFLLSVLPNLTWFYANDNFPRLSLEHEEKSNELVQQTAMVDKMKQLHNEQCQELERQIEIVGSSNESACIP